MHVIVAGTRDPARDDIGRLWTALDLLLGWAVTGGEPLAVIHGAGRGIDTAAHVWYQRQLRLLKQVIEKPYPARWRDFGRRAGPLRTSLMWAENWHLTDLCLTFPGAGPGTIRCEELAREYGRPLWSNRSGHPLTPPPAARLIPENWSTRTPT